VVQDFAEGIKWYKQSAEKGQVEAQETLGGLYFFGKGAAQDYAEAAKWYGMAAKQGKVYPQYLLGLHVRPGQGRGTGSGAGRPVVSQGRRTE
jgi:TPR repeat protein